MSRNFFYLENIGSSFIGKQIVCISGDICRYKITQCHLTQGEIEYDCKRRIKHRFVNVNQSMLINERNSAALIHICQKRDRLNAQ